MIKAEVLKLIQELLDKNSPHSDYVVVTTGFNTQTSKISIKRLFGGS